MYVLCVRGSECPCGFQPPYAPFHGIMLCLNNKNNIKHDNHILGVLVKSFHPVLYGRYIALGSVYRLLCDDIVPLIADPSLVMVL
jgi:hypothetical protein